MHKAKSQLSRLVESAYRGEEVIISKDGVPVARLIPMVQRTEKRKLGQARGMAQMSDDFNQPLSEKESEQFFGL